MSTKRKAKKKASAPKTVSAYLAALPKDQRAALTRLRKLIHATVPDVEERLSYGLCGFRVHDRWLVYLGAAKGHCAMYGVLASKKELAGYDLSGRGTLRFQPDAPLPAALVRKILKGRIAQILAK